MKTKLLILLISLLVVGGGAAAFVYGKVYLDDSNRFAAAVMKSLKNDEGSDVSVSLHYKLSSDFIDLMNGLSMNGDVDQQTQNNALKFVNGILDETSLSYRAIAVPNKKEPMNGQWAYTFSAKYGEDSLVDLVYYLDKEELGFMLPSLTGNGFYITKEDLYDMLDIDPKDTGVDRYMKIIQEHSKEFKKIDDKAYKEVLEEVLDDSIEKGDKVTVELADGDTVKCREYQIEISLGDVVDILDDLAKIAEDDDELREAIRSLSLDLVTELEDSQDYEKLQMSDSDLEGILDILEDEDDFEDGYSEAIGILRDGLDLYSLGETSDWSMTFTYAIDITNHIRRVVSEYNIMGIESTVECVVNSYHPKFNMEEYDVDKVDMAKWVDNEDAFNKDMEDTFKDLGDHLKDNKALENLLDDVANKSDLLEPEVRQGIIQGIEEYKANKDEFIDSLVQGMLDGLYEIDQDFLENGPY